MVGWGSRDDLVVKSACFSGREDLGSVPNIHMAVYSLP